VRRSIARLRGALAMICVALVTACATPVQTPPDTAAAAYQDAAFEVEGRLSATRGADAITANFSWSHDVGNDRIDLTTPLGGTVARLTGDRDGAKIELSDRRVLRAPSFDALTSDALGLPIPVAGLTAWLNGKPRAGSAHSLTRDAQGRAQSLRQDGWEIEYVYADERAALPARLLLHYPGAEPVEMRIVVDNWS
jgi:outer membrane lipoprotein LolB